MVYTCDICGEAIVTDEDKYSKLYHSDDIEPTVLCERCTNKLYLFMDEMMFEEA